MLHSEIDAKLVLVSARKSRGADHAVSRHHHSRASLRVRALSVRHPGNNLRSAIVRHPRRTATQLLMHPVERYG